MLEQIQKVLEKIDGLVWGLPLIVLILATGILLTCLLGGLQVRHLGRALRYMVKNEEGGHGEVSSFGALCTAMSATIGTGNIVGVATALVAGGPGALFWMVVAAFFGMATKYTEGVLAVHYRTIDENGHALGGPFYYIERGMGKNWRWLAQLFAFFGMGVGLLGIGTFTQINGISSAVKGFFDPQGLYTVSLFGREYSWAVVIAGLIVTLCVAAVVLGGLKRIASVAQIIVPFMAVIYILFGLSVILLNAVQIPAALLTIVRAAFSPAAVTGGVVGSVTIAMQKGIARGIFSNEAGLGSAPIAHAATSEKNPVKQGLYGIFEVFMDTIVICTLTSLVVLCSGAADGNYGNDALAGVPTAVAGFSSVFGDKAGSLILAVGLLLFATSTILGWALYGTRCAEFLFGSKIIRPYQIVFCLVVIAGAVADLTLVWDISDTLNGLMSIPNLIALLLLSPVVIKLTREHFKK